MSRATILAEVSAERERQDALFGGASHDDTHTATHWVSILVRHVGLAVDDGSPDGICLMNDHCAGSDPARYRRQMVRVAAVAIAALETFDRKCAPLPPAVPDSLTCLRTSGQALANEWGETVLLIADPPLSPINRFKSTIPYCCFAAVADPAEIKAAVERFEPQRKELPHV